MSAALFDRFLSTPAMTEAFGDAALVQAMLDFEAALVRAQSAEGLAPPSAAIAIAAACRVERFDIDAIVSGGSVAGTLVIPLVKQLTAAVAAHDVDAAGFVHVGSTSQDVLDTAMVLVTRRAFDLIDASLGNLTRALLALADSQTGVPMLGRTLLQPAQVISVDFKLIGWVAPLVRCRERLRGAAARALRLQLGGAVGTLSGMGAHGASVARRMAADLKIGHAEGAWHAQRDEWVALACEVGVLCGALGKIATDLSLLAQAEIAEMTEPSGGAAGEQRGGSSTMPHKRNPVASMVALAAATRAPHRVAALLAAMPQQHERGLGNWQAELAEWPGLFLSAHGALTALADAAPGVRVDPARMRANIDSLQGLVFAEAASALLAREVGKAKAHALMERLSTSAVAQKRALHDVVLDAIGAESTLASSVSRAEVTDAFDVAAAARRASAFGQPQWRSLRARVAALDAAPPLSTTETLATEPSATETVTR